MILLAEIKNNKINLSNFICYFGIFLLFIPKINFISFKGQSAGVRIDDIVILLIAVVIFTNYLYKKNKKFSKSELIFYFLILISLFSNIFNILLYKQSNFLYSFRNAEYFVFFYIGYLSKNIVSLTRLSYGYIIVSTVVIVLQMLGLLGGFRSEGYFSDVSSRAVGLTGGPWEVGVILMFALSIIIYSTSRYIYKVLITIVVFILLLLTGARLPTLSFFIVIGIWAYSTSKNKFILISLILIIIPFFGLLLSLVDNPVLERSSNLLSYSNIEQFLNYYNTIKVDSVFVDFPDMPIDETSDMSWLFRVSKWSYAIKYWLTSNIGYLIGLGPGIWGIALDGGWVRMLTENGLIGIGIYISYLKEIMNIHITLKMLVIVLVINMFMIDIYMAYKCMAFFFFTIGYLCKPDQFIYSIKVK